MLKVKFLNRMFSWKELWALRGSFVRLFLRLFNISLLMNLVKLYFSRFLQLSHVYGLPYLVMIEPTSRCNLRCPMCGRTFAGLKRKETDMSFSEFQTVFDKLKANLLAIGFWNLGEPLLNKELFKMIECVYREKIFSIVLTNGTLFDEDRSKQAIESGLDYLGVSIDGASATTYNKYRLGGNFETVVNNVKFLIEEKKRRKSLTPFVEIIFLVMKDNEDEIDAILELARQMGVDKLSLKKVSLGSAEKFLDISEFLPVNSRFIHSIHKVNSRLKTKCVLPWLQMGINADGNVVSCCGDYSSVKMGDIFVSPVKPIWNGPKFRDFRKKMNQNIDQIDSCKLCAERNYDTDIFLSLDV